MHEQVNVALHGNLFKGCCRSIGDPRLCEEGGKTAVVARPLQERLTNGRFIKLLGCYISTSDPASLGCFRLRKKYLGIGYKVNGGRLFK
jgi:hypothetical protein